MYSLILLVPFLTWSEVVPGCLVGFGFMRSKGVVDDDRLHLTDKDLSLFKLSCSQQGRLPLLETIEHVLFF